MSTHVLDHIVHISAPGSVEHVSAEFRKLGFVVIPGGTHAGGKSYNALVVLHDGVYLELIAFVRDPPPSERWGSAPPGWVDFANLGLVPDVARVINERAAKDGSRVAYCAGVSGGRVTPEGRTLKWRVTVPEARHGLGKLPFFCEDLTPRKWRVPEPLEHPSSARGISHVKVLASSEEEFTMLAAQITTVLGVPPSLNARSAIWPLQTPTPLPGLHTHLILEQVGNADQASGLHEVGFWVEKGCDRQPDSPYGKIVWTHIP